MIEYLGIHSEILLNALVWIWLTLTGHKSDVNLCGAVYIVRFCWFGRQLETI